MKFLVFTLTLLVAFYVNAQVFISPNPNVMYYTATGPAFAPPATPTDLCYIKGSATKVIKIKAIKVTSNQSTGGANQFFLFKRTTANAGGTGTFMSSFGFDSGFPTPTAITSSYSVNPVTLGVTSGPLYIDRVFSAASTAQSEAAFSFLSSDQFKSPIVLRGVSEGLAVSFNGATLPAGLTVQCTFEFSEE